MNNHKQSMSLMLGIMALVATMFVVIFTEINQVEDAQRTHTELPAHAVASEKFTNIEEKLDILIANNNG